MAPDTDNTAAAEAEKAPLDQNVQQSDQKAEGQGAAQDAQTGEQQPGEQAKADEQAQQDAPTGIPDDLSLEAMTDDEIAHLVVTGHNGTDAGREANIDFLRSLRPAPVEAAADADEATDRDGDGKVSLEERVAFLEEAYRKLELRTRHFV